VFGIIEDNIEVICSPAVFENKQDVVSEGVSVLLQDPAHIVKHLQPT